MWPGSGPVLVLVEPYALGDVAAAQRAVLQGVAADLAAADVTAGQEDDLSLEHRKTR